MARRGARGEGSVYQRAKDGRWVATVGGARALGKRVRKSFYGDTQKQAIDARKKYLRDLEDGLTSARAGRAPKPFTVGDWLDYWLDKKVAVECEPTTLETYRIVLNRHLQPRLGPIPLKQLEIEHVEAWIDDLAKRGVGLRTRQFALARLRTALNFGLLRKQQTGLRYNAATLVAMPSGGQKTKVPPPNLEHARALLDAARGDRLEAFVTVGLSLGLRRGEVTGLKWEDIDMEVRTITIRRRVSRIRGALLVRQGVKMDPDKQDTVAFPALMVPALRRHRGRQLAERLRVGDRWKGPEPTVDGNPSGFVFTSLVGTVLEPRNVFRSFEAIRHRAGLDDKTFHQLRHDCASLLLAQGVPMYAVSQILRHSSPAITARFYAHLTPELQRQAADEMDKVLGPLLNRLGS